MNGEFTYADIIVYFVKSFAMNLYMFYSFSKSVNIKEIKFGKQLILLGFNLLLAIVHTFVDYKFNSALSTLAIYLIFGVFLGITTRNKLGFSLVITAISYAICNVALLLSVTINFALYSAIYKVNYILNTISVIALQFILIYLFFKIKRFRNGFSFLNKKLNNDITDVIVGFTGIAILLMSTFMGSLYKVNRASVHNIFYIFIILVVAMFVMLQRTLTMHYKQGQLLKTLDEYKDELEEKNKEIEKLSNEKFNTSKIRHEFYHRQKALELLVKENVHLTSNISKENVNQNILDIINSLTQEYSDECKKVKQLSELKKTGIVEIDSMFKYMQEECNKNNIEFKFKNIGDIHPLINNIISKSRLETLIGDHIKDAINAVNNESVKNKEILVILGKKDKKYELSIYDTGIEFEISTLIHLGKMPISTCTDIGGSGIGFLTTFETLNETKASLIITENEPTDNRYYTKSVTIRFDGKKQYKICSYRSKEISNCNNREDIIIESI